LEKQQQVEKLAEKKTSMRSAVFTDTPVKIALEVEVQARAKPVKYKKLFSGSQDKEI
jgi:hypothetical protein